MPQPMAITKVIANLVADSDRQKMNGSPDRERLGDAATSEFRGNAWSGRIYRHWFRIYHGPDAAS